VGGQDAKLSLIPFLKALFQRSGIAAYVRVAADPLTGYNASVYTLGRSKSLEVARRRRSVRTAHGGTLRDGWCRTGEGGIVARSVFERTPKQIA
jgi:hypothetical protein